MDRFNLKFSISPDVIDQEVQLGETLLLDVKTLTYYSLTSFGTVLWREMQSGSDLDEVYTRVVRQSDLPENELAAVIHAIVQGLASSRLLSLEPY